MPTVAEILAFEPVLEQWFKSGVEASGVSVEASMSAEAIATPYVSLVVTSGGSTGRLRNVRSGATLYPDAWTFNVTIIILTDRGDTTQLHWDIVGKVRKRMAEFQDFTPMTNLGVGSLVEADSSREVSNDFRHDKTTLSYNGTVVVRPAAWP